MHCITIPIIDEDVCMCSDDQVCVREGFGEATCRDRK